MCVSKSKQYCLICKASFTVLLMKILSTKSVFILIIFLLSLTWLLAQDFETYLKKSNEKFKQGNYAGAIKDLDKALEENKNSAEAYQKRGRSKRYAGNILNAVSDYNTALRINPNNGNAYIGRGQAKLRMQDYEAAISDYNTALQISPKSVHLKNILYNRALCKNKLARFDEALLDYNKVLEINAEDMKALVNRGVIRYNKGEVRQACADWLKAKGLGSKKAGDNAKRACQCCM